jgi:sialate O-acetylesterase
VTNRVPQLSRVTPRRVRIDPSRARHRAANATLLALSAALLGMLAPAAVHAALRLPAIVGDHMVLQQGRPTVWGWARAGSEITVAIASRQASARAGPDGRWKVRLSALPPGGPYAMTIAGDGTLTVSDVLIGDVWLAAGQSNMQLSVRVAQPDGEPITAQGCQNLRVFTVERMASRVPVTDVVGSWQVCDASTAQEFSAVAYYFGRDVERFLKIPVGLITSAWGRTSAVVWLPEEGSPPGSGAVGADKAQTGAFDLALSDLRLLPNDPARAPVPIHLAPREDGLGGHWAAGAKEGSVAEFVAEDAQDPGAAPRFSGRLHDENAWASAVTPLRPAQKTADLTAFRALALRVRGYGDFKLALTQPTIHDSDLYASDVVHPSPEWRVVEFPFAALRQGGWGVAQKLTQDAIESVVLIVEAAPPSTRGSVYNGMIFPLTGFGLRGVLWYQGESDTGQAASYGRVLRRLVQSWRGAWHDERLPFLVVQLASYGQVQQEPGESSRAEIREAQRQLLDLDATAVVTTIDIGDPADIHPRNKAEVGRRLALAAWHVAYGRPIVASGPVLEHATAQPDGRVVLKFAKDSGDLLATGREPLAGFALSSDGRRFYWANARIAGKNAVEVWSDAVSRPVEVRYAWADNPTCNLINAAGLPASPFRAFLRQAARASNRAMRSTSATRSPAAPRPGPKHAP